jgi:hypothetical protein
MFYLQVSNSVTAVITGVIFRFCWMFYLQVSNSVTAVITGVIFRFANTASAITLPIPDKKKEIL